MHQNETFFGTIFVHFQYVSRALSFTQSNLQAIETKQTLTLFLPVKVNQKTSTLIQSTVVCPLSFQNGPRKSGKIKEQFLYLSKIGKIKEHEGRLQYRCSRICRVVLISSFFVAFITKWVCLENLRPKTLVLTEKIRQKALFKYHFSAQGQNCFTIMRSFVESNLLYSVKVLLTL